MKVTWQNYSRWPPTENNLTLTLSAGDISPTSIRVCCYRRAYPINMPLCASTGPVLVRCCQHPTSTGPVLATNGMFTGTYLRMWVAPRSTPRLRPPARRSWTVPRATQSPRGRRTPACCPPGSCHRLDCHSRAEGPGRTRSLGTENGIIVRVPNLISTHIMAGTDKVFFFSISSSWEMLVYG